MSDFLSVLGRRLLIGDGAMGTMLQARGLKPGQPPEVMNVTAPGVVLGVHREYVAAGCGYITANTFGAQEKKLAGSGVSARQAVTAGVRLARQAADEAGRRVFVALDLGPTGRMMAPAGDLEFDEAAAIFAGAVRAGAEAGADFILAETMTDIAEARAALIAARESCALPVVVSVTFDLSGRTLTGTDARTAALLLENWGADGFGINCGMGPGQIGALAASTDAAIPVFLAPNAGLPVIEGGCTHYAVGPEEFFREMEPLAGRGCAALGGCCGTTPEHIAKIAALAGSFAPRPVRPAPGPWISSPTRLLDISGGLPALGVIPDGLAGEDAREAAFDALDSGAAALSVPPCAVWAVSGLLPLVIRGGEGLAEALRAYPGRAAVEVRSESDAAAAVKYGAVILRI